MSNRRPLAETLVNMIDGVLLSHPGLGLRVTSIEMTLPIEVSMEGGDIAPEFRADLPQNVYRTAFDHIPSHLTVTWAEGGTP